MSSNGKPAGATGNGEPAGIDFLDFLFTLAISVGLSPGILGIEGWSGLLSEEWLKQGVLPSGQALYDFLVFSLGFLTLTLSWFGYHGSIRKKPLKYGTFPGMVRFIFDVLLVVIYGLILLQYKNFKVVLFLLLVVHFIFVVWDIVKIIEHWTSYQEKAGGHLRRYRREYVSVVFLALFLILWLSGTQSSIAVVLAILFIVLYRVNKEYPMWERIFGVKSD